MTGSASVRQRDGLALLTSRVHSQIDCRANSAGCFASNAGHRVENLEALIEDWSVCCAINSGLARKPSSDLAFLNVTASDRTIRCEEPGILVSAFELEFAEVVNGLIAGFAVGCKISGGT